MRRGSVTGLAALFLLAPLALTGCGENEPAPTAGAVQTGDGAALVARGAELFKLHCSMCHGLEGRGDGPGAVALPVKPRNLTAEPYKYVDIAGSGSEIEALKRYIAAGKLENQMPAFGHLPDADLTALAHFVESIRPADVAPPTGGGAAAPSPEE